MSVSYVQHESWIFLYILNASAGVLKVLEMCSQIDGLKANKLQNLNSDFIRALIFSFYDLMPPQILKLECLCMWCYNFCVLIVNLYDSISPQINTCRQHDCCTPVWVCVSVCLSLHLSNTDRKWSLCMTSNSVTGFNIRSIFLLIYFTANISLLDITELLKLRPGDWCRFVWI